MNEISLYSLKPFYLNNSKSHSNKSLSNSLCSTFKDISFYCKIPGLEKNLDFIKNLPV